jgi:hypothetical protein
MSQAPATKKGKKKRKPLIIIEELEAFALSRIRTQSDYTNTRHVYNQVKHHLSPAADRAARRILRFRKKH